MFYFHCSHKSLHRDKTYSGVCSTPDVNYISACATSKNLPSYESTNQPNGTYMTELSKYIGPECNYTVLSIISEISQGNLHFSDHSVFN